MANVIIIQNRASKEQMEQAIKAIPAAMTNGLICIADTPAAGGQSERTYVSPSKFSLTSCMQIALEKSKGEVVTVIDAQSAPSSEALSALSEGMSRPGVGLMYIPIEGSQDSLPSELAPDSLMTMISSEMSWPAACFSIRRDIMERTEINGDSLAEILVKFMIQANAQGENVSASSISLPASAVTSEMAMSPISRARSLRSLLKTNGIEELFPFHSWSAHHDESAAASYHTLAALFIRLGDSTSALECLSLGDELEDSPRSLALKGIIALERGETLTAVANMVSSLQQYEMRKRHNTKHYVHFSPRDVETISSSLNAGLEALNKRDNESALSHFTKAVFSFDPFYSEVGVASLRSSQH